MTIQGNTPENNNEVQDWKDQVAYLAQPRYFKVTVEVDPDLSGSLTTSQADRLDYKLQLVERAAARMAANMLKGVLKYEADATSLVPWLEHLMDEGADQMNYQMLLIDAWERSQDV